MDKLCFDKNLPTWNMRNKIINTLKYHHPYIKTGTVGRSAAGRNIHIIESGKGQHILFTAAYHGMEWLTSLLMLKMLDDIYSRADNPQTPYDFNLSRIVKQKHIVTVPCVNPDGVEISLLGAKAAGKYEELVRKVCKDTFNSWQANARGVDINHNFSAGWNELHDMEINSGICAPSPTRYGGKSPESEPETRAITKLCRSLPFSYATAFHSQGEEIYWSYGKNTPTISEPIAQNMAEKSGYTVSAPEGLAVGGGFKDWFIEEFRRPAFTVEIGFGKNPLPLSHLDPIYKKISSMLEYLILI